MAKNELSAKRVSFALAGVAGIVYIVCVALAAIAPGLTIALFESIFHGLEITGADLTFGGFILGFVGTIALSLVIGWGYTALYNRI
jgi:hypothetical protein